MKTLMISAAALGLMAVSAVAEDFEFTIGAGAPPAVPPVRAIDEAALPAMRAAAEAAGHEVEITTGYGGSLYNIQNTLEGVRDGLADAGWVGANWEPDNMPLNQIITALPFVNNDGAIGQAIDLKMQATPQFAEEWTKNGLVYLGATGGDDYIIVSTKAIKTFEDLKGVKIFVPGNLAQWMEGTGASPLNGNLPAMVNGLQTGVADAALIPLGGAFIFKFYEFAPYILFPGIGTAAMNGGLAMNAEVWEDLPDTMKAAWKAGGDAYTKATLKMGAGLSAAALKAFDEADGVTVTTLSREDRIKWANAMPNVAMAWRDRVNALGLDGDAALDVFIDTAKELGADVIRDWRQ